MQPSCSGTNARRGLAFNHDCTQDRIPVQAAALGLLEGLTDREIQRHPVLPRACLASKHRLAAEGLAQLNSHSPLS